MLVAASIVAAGILDSNSVFAQGWSVDARSIARGGVGGADNVATRMIEAWGDDVPGGKTTDFKSAVKATPDEVVTFSWHEYPDKAAADAAYHTMMSDPRVAKMVATMPFNGQRMMIGGFTSIIDLAWGPNRALYVYEIAAGGWHAFEEGFTTGVFPPAVLLKVKDGHRRELVPGKLSQPGGIVVTRFGTVYVTDGTFGDGRLLKIRSY